MRPKIRAAARVTIPSTSTPSVGLCRLRSQRQRTLECKITAIDEQVRTRHERGFIGGEKKGTGGNLVGPSGAAEKVVRAALPVRSLAVAGKAPQGALGVDAAGRQRVH